MTRGRIIRFVVTASVIGFAVPAAHAETPPVQLLDTHRLVVGADGIDAVAAVAGALKGGERFGQVVVAQGARDNLVVAIDADQRTRIARSFNGNRGILDVNQEAGAVNSQANIRVIAFNRAKLPIEHLGLVRGAVSVGNTIRSRGGSRANAIRNSFADSAGIAGVNQATGAVNQQVNALVFGVGQGSGDAFVALADTALGVVGADNVFDSDPTIPLSNEVTESFTRFRGFAQVNQASGDGNVMGNMLGVSVSVMTVQ